jgi:hypothetical protein
MLRERRERERERGLIRVRVRFRFRGIALLGVWVRRMTNGGGPGLCCVEGVEDETRHDKISHSYLEKERDLLNT